ncbi:hypothetical protein D9757_003192 [Collybiopsis confluens]|uniref:Uncharacterized protein n=1 Tax=Collybiopsis confluens TaxID=2823264 RepID=A0A8H5HYZ9_9AGAR|nr:hypothetical protein D9757_003192 [Collybiopsis confluens]
MSVTTRSTTSGGDGIQFRSNSTDGGSSYLQERLDSSRPIWQHPYFFPLTVDDEFEIFDLELVRNQEKKQIEILVRSRSYPTGRPAYKVEKTTRSHLLGKKNMDMYISRSEAWDSTGAKPVPSQSVLSGKAYYVIIFQAMDQPARHLSLSPTKGMILYRTSRGSEITISSRFGPHDPVHTRAPLPRVGTCYHYTPLHLTDFEPRMPEHGQLMRIPAALLKRYSGGGYLLFDAHSQGRSDLLSTLYCTGYERRSFPRKGDIVLAELRLSRPGSSQGPGPRFLWKRFFQERHASLFISKRGMRAVFVGRHVNMAVPNPSEGNRYTLTIGQAQETVLSLFASSLMAIEHEGLEKKWGWLLERELMELPMPGSAFEPPAPSDPSSEEYTPLSVQQTREQMDASEVESIGEDSKLVRRSSFDNWKVAAYNTLMDKNVKREPQDGLGVARMTDSPPFVDDKSTLGSEEGLPYHRPSASDDSEFGQTPYADGPPVEFRPVEDVQSAVDIPRSAEQSTKDLPQTTHRGPKEGPKVTGIPKLSDAIYW